MQTYVGACKDPTNASAVALASAADVAVLVLGLDTTHGGQHDTDSEGHDRRSVGLPDSQAALAAAVLAVGKPTVIVVVGGSDIWAQELGITYELLLYIH